MDIKKKVMLFILIFLLISISQIFLVSADKTPYTWNRIREYYKDLDCFVFHLEFESLDKKEELKDYEFIFGDRLTICILTVLRTQPDNFKFEPENIKLISPTEHEPYPESFRSFGKDSYIAGRQFEHLGYEIANLNETGTWPVIIEFDRKDDSGPYFSFIYYGDNVLDFKNDSEIYLFFGTSVSVLTNSEYQQIVTNKRNIELTNTANTVLIASALATGCLAFIAFVTVLRDHYRYKRIDKERITEKRITCKQIANESMLAFEQLLKEIYDFYKRKSFDNISEYDLKPYKKMSNKLEQVSNKLGENIAYIQPHHGTEDIHESMRNISNKLQDFKNNSWKKMQGTTEDEFNRIGQEIESLQNDVQDFFNIQA